MTPHSIENLLQNSVDEILFGSSDKTVSQQISRLEKAGKIKKIVPRVYTSNITEKPEVIIKRNWYKILAHLYPGALLSHRSALEFKPTAAGDIFITYKYTKNNSLPGLVVRALKGTGPLEGDPSFFKELHVSGEARAFLENFQTAKTKGRTSKTLSRESIENKLDTIIRTRGEDGLNLLRDHARIIAPELRMEKEFQQLDSVISALLSTHNSNVLHSPLSKARLSGFPYDPARIDLLNNLYEHLADREFPAFQDRNQTASGYQSFAFFESYFSNYIEGTKFEIEEAKEIILTETPIPTRDEDSHDILGTYQIAADKKEMGRRPETAEQLLETLKYRHAILLSARPSKAPGHFKDRNNRAGNTEFVDWQLVAGTLKKGFEFYALLRAPFSRAAYIMFLISEVHPFLDGNGRIARIMMNAELSSRGMSKIIIPTVYREDYMGALRVLTRQGDPAPYIRMLSRAYEFSATVHQENMDEMQVYLTACNAFKEPEEAKLKYTRH